jgi:hypothetical protein
LASIRIGNTLGMDTSEKFVHAAIDVPDLARVAEAEGPFLSLYLRTEAAVENAGAQVKQHWKTVRRDLVERGVEDGLLKEIDEIVPRAHLEGECLAVIGGVHQILHVEHGPAVSPIDEATWGPLPRLLPIVRWRQSEPPYMLVLTDRSGADLFGFRRGAPELEATVEGEHDELRKVGPGGWAQRRFQQRAEDSWEHNAKQVAERVERLLAQIQPVFVAVGGDVRAVHLLRDSLSTHFDDLIHVIEGERPWEGKGDPIPDVVDELVEQHVREATAGLLERFAEERGQDDKAVEGVAATARALAQAQVAVLLIADESTDDRHLWFGPDPALLSPIEQDLKDLGVEAPVRERAADVLIRGALGTGAGIRVVDAGAVEEGVGALLRWSA